MRGVEIYVAPLVAALRIPTLLPPELFALGLEYLRSLSGLKVSPQIISLGAEDLLLPTREADAVEVDIIVGLGGWFAVLTTCVFILSPFIFPSRINFLATKISYIIQKSNIKIKNRIKNKYVYKNMYFV
jgi:hypothetical protein